MKTRRTFLVCGLVVLALPFAAHAQQSKKIYWIGFLSSISAEQSSHLYAAFLQGLRDHGYVEGQNLVIESRWADEKPDRLQELAAELVRLNPDLIVSTGGVITALAVKKATASIPVVFTAGGNLVEIGLVASLARPGGNLTGVSLLTTELNTKRLEVLKEAFPRVRRVAVLARPATPVYAIQLKEIQAAAKKFALQLQILEARGPDDIEPSFSAMIGQSAGALLVLSDPMFNAHRKRIVDLASKNRIPAIYEFREFVEVGGLLSYGTSITDVYRRAAVYVDKILKGAKPGDLPVELPTTFELVINMKTARALGITIPQPILLRADRVIE
jgi:putative ABC transport system substrate-binding protein